MDEAIIPEVLGTAVSGMTANEPPQVELVVEQETETESNDSHILYEDVSAQMNAAKEFTTLVATQIVESADSILNTAAHLGPQRVVMLLA